MKLLIFTQKVDKNDSTLGFFHEWILEFSKKFESVKVICLYMGDYSLPENVEVFSLGKESGASSFFQMLHVFKNLWSVRGQYDRVFVHMNPIYLVLCGWYFFLKRIPVYMWYVHKSVDLKLKIATFYSTNIFTSAKESFRLSTNKVIYLGHGIDVDRLPYSQHKYNNNPLEIFHIGRITQIKKVEVAILLAYELKKRGLNPKLVLSGNCETEGDIAYKNTLEALIVDKGLVDNVEFRRGVLYQELPNELKGANITVNMAPPGGMDKVVLTSLLLGIPVFTANTAFTGVFEEYADTFLYKYNDPKDLADKILAFIQRNEGEEIIVKLSNKVRNNYSLKKLVETVFNIMNK